MASSQGGNVSEPQPRLETALRDRLREIAGSAPATESELRTLAEKADAWARTLGGLVSAAERRVDALSADPESSLAEIAVELDDIERARAELAELQDLLVAFDARARSLRTEWLLGQTRSSSPARP
jgi:hypothetical protein